MARAKKDRLGRPIKAHSEITCSSCGCRIGLANTRFGAQALKTKNPKCGPCYLKWRIEVRKAKGIL